MFVFWFILLFAVKSTFTHEIIFDRIESPFGEKDKIISFDSLRVKKYNRTLYVLNGKYTIKRDVDDSYSAILYGFNLQGGQYKKLGEKRVDKIFQTLYEDKYMEPYNEFQANSDKPIPWKTYPYPAGTYEMTNYIIEDKGRLPAYIPGGEKWRIDIRILLGEEVLGGYNFYLTLRNQKNLMEG